MPSDENVDVPGAKPGEVGRRRSRPQMSWTRIAVYLGLLAVMFAFASGYYTLITRPAVEPREATSTDPGENVTPPPESTELRFLPDVGAAGRVTTSEPGASGPGISPSDEASVTDKDQRPG